MKSFAAAVLSLSLLAPVAGFAQATDSDRATYCWVKNSDKHEIWLSQAFSTPPGTDASGAVLATEFLAYVGTLGGGGEKSCVTSATREAADASRRAEIAAIMRKRSFGIRIYDLHEVNWTPSAAKSADAAPAPKAAPAVAPPVAVEPPVAAQPPVAPVAMPAVAAPPVTPPAATPPVATAPPVAPVATKPASADLASKIASDAFFRLPKGKEAPLHRSGSRVVNKTLPVSSDTTLRRVPGSNQCHLEQTVLAGEGGMYKTVASGETWAGFIPLNMRSQMSSKRGVIDSVLKAVAIEKTMGKPFPLVAGNTFGWSVSYESLNNSTDIARYGQDWSCKVGASAPASTTIPGMAGKQTEVQCHLSFVSVPAPPQDQVYFWYDAAGCFMQDPTR